LTAPDVSITRADGGWTLTARTHVRRPLPDVFAFFADCRNLEVLTPPELQFRILTPGAHEVRRGLRIDYRLRIWGIPFQWQSLISVWEPGRRFVDEQTRGPYRRWRHEHRFQAVDDGTIVTDRVDYSVPGGAIAHRIVRPQLMRIFRYRASRLAELLER
jgi:ligand-binding SRPBCC domain-containing protein